jgi:hypothetical protein
MWQLIFLANKRAILVGTNIMFSVIDLFIISLFSKNWIEDKMNVSIETNVKLNVGL